MKIKISELFYSIQGEGRYMGVPSVFLRTFGCNFKCSGFGMERGLLSTEADDIAEMSHKYKTYSQLPLVTTGCDSYASWHPGFKDLSPTLDVEVIAGRIMNMLPHKEWRDEHLVITGGEPLLGWQRSFPDLLNLPNMASLKELTFETNGTQKLSNDFKEFLTNWGLKRSFPHGREKYQGGNGWNSITFSVSPKLSVSGESWNDAINPDIVADYQTVGYTYLKFVVDSMEDINEAVKAVEEYRSAGFTGPVYLMPVGGVESVYSLNNKAVAKGAMLKGFRYSDRLQVPLFKNEWGT
jgi:7-carboxy-7-deazaguanine synthase